VVTSSGAFSELVDTLLNGMNELRRGGARGTQATRKGTVVTPADLRKRWGLDRLLVGRSGCKLIVRARLRPAPPASRYADRCRA